MQALASAQTVVDHASNHADPLRRPPGSMQGPFHLKVPSAARSELRGKGTMAGVKLSPRILRGKRPAGRRAVRHLGIYRSRRENYLDQIPASRLATRLEVLRNTLRPTPHVQLAM